MLAFKSDKEQRDSEQQTRLSYCLRHYPQWPTGSVIVWPGSTWHGAYPKKTKGLRLSAIVFYRLYRHSMVQPQEILVATMKDQPWDDCDNPEMMRELIGLDDPLPYVE